MVCLISPSWHTHYHFASEIPHCTAICKVKYFWSAQILSFVLAYKGFVQMCQFRQMNVWIGDMFMLKSNIMILLILNKIKCLDPLEAVKYSKDDMDYITQFRAMNPHQ